MDTILLFLHGPYGARGGEYDLLAAIPGPGVTAEHILEVARDTISATDSCRIGVIHAGGGKASALLGWRVRRYRTKEEMPMDCFFEYMPGSVCDIQDDMRVEINLAPWVAIVQEKL